MPGGTLKDFKSLDRDSSGHLDLDEIRNMRSWQARLRRYFTLDVEMQSDVRIRMLQLLCVPLLGLFAIGLWLLVVFMYSSKVITACSLAFLNLTMATTIAKPFTQWAWVVACIGLGVFISTLLMVLKAGSGAVKAKILHRYRQMCLLSMAHYHWLTVSLAHWLTGTLAHWLTG